MKMSRVELDTVDFSEPGLQTFLKENQIQTRIITKRGPSGWPLIEYRGSKNCLKELIHFFWLDDNLWNDIH